MLRNVFLVISTLLVVFLGYSFFQEYFALHPYYDQMLASNQNWKVVIRWLVFALIPAWYLFYAKKKTFWWVIWSLFIWLYLFTLTYINIKASVYGWAVKLFINDLFLFGLAMYMLAAFTTLGIWIKERFLKLSTEKIFDVIMNLGIWLAVFLLINYILILTNTFFTVVSWLLFVGVWVLMWFQRDRLTNTWEIVSGRLDFFTINRSKEWWLAAWGKLSGVIKIIGIILLLFSIWYIFNGFILAYLPYPTAWDANHAYMFYPKMWALNSWYYRWQAGMMVGPQFWYVFIAYWFNLFSPSGFLWITADTVAIQMNFWSWFLVLIFGLWLVAEVINFLRGWTKKINVNTHMENLVFMLWWFLVLQWLTSGMGAFLVFIDNKTDLWVFALIILAVYSGFVFLSHLQKSNESARNIAWYLWLSWFFYAVAALAKPTAMFDVVNFGLFLWWIWFGWLWVIWLFLIILWVLSTMWFRWIKWYLPEYVWQFLLIPGLIWVGWNAVWVYIKKLWTYIRYFVIWAWVFFVSLLVIKWSYIFADIVRHDKDQWIGTFVERLLFWALPVQKNTTSTSWLAASDLVPLYAQAGNVIPVDQCTLAGQWFSSIDELYATTQKPEWNAQSEDVGRYVWYGWKWNVSTDQRRWIVPFKNPWWAAHLNAWCYGFNPLFIDTRDAKVLCAMEDDWRSFDAARLNNVIANIGNESSYKDQLIKDKLIELKEASETDSSVDQLRLEFAPLVNDLEQYMQQNTMKIVDNSGVQEVYLPYRFLNIFNISFNWSLQNLSSYYTDIGIVWLMLFVFILVWLVYGIIARKRVLITLNLVTLFGWILWWFIGWGILWYAIGIIIWTILSFVVYFYYMLNDEEKWNSYILSMIFAAVFFIFLLVQIWLNMVRIASQWWWGAFMWYKTNYGVTEQYDEALQRDARPRRWYTWENVFDLQFPHYKKFIQLANEREEGEGALIAGTYARYFVENQYNIRYDQFLTWFWEMLSDSDVCNTYLRLTDQNLRYLVLDPNIWTVVQGAWNQSLFDRLYARVDTTNGTIIEDGTMSMLAKMYDAWYLRYISSNNLGAKYAFMTTKETYSWLSWDALSLFRARMVLARFFGNDAAVISTANQIAEQRVQDGTFISDIADIMWLIIDEGKMLQLLQKQQLTAADINTLTQDERRALVQFLNIRQLSINDEQAFKQQIATIVRDSIRSGNQIVVLELL